VYREATDEARALPLLAPSPDLAAEGPPLAPVFPLEDRGTRLVLYQGPPGELRIHWRLERDDFERAAASFPLNGRRPATVVRLRRDRPQGGTDQADEIQLGLGVREGSGERGVRIPMDHCRYHAELGLTNADGGWLMLVRSNGLYNAAGIGLDLERLPPDRGEVRLQLEPSECAVETVTAPASPGPGARVHPVGRPVEPALGGGTAATVDPDFPIIPWARSGMLSRAPSSGAAEGEPGLFVEPGGAGNGRGQAAQVEGRVGASPWAGLAAGAHAPTEPAQVAVGSQGPGPVLPAGAPGPHGSMPTRIGIPLTPLTYESPPERASGLELEAELRITGRAPPGSTVDLFGFHYRVGPGGRFQLILPVTDPELLRWALEAAPPAELTRRRDD
jgi:hypothetical protein